MLTQVTKSKRERIGTTKLTKPIQFVIVRKFSVLNVFLYESFHKEEKCRDRESSGSGKHPLVV